MAEVCRVSGGDVIGGILYDSLGHVAVFGLAAVMALAAAGLGGFAFPTRATPRRPIVSATGP